MRTAVSILPCCRLSCASVATAASHSGSVRNASLQHLSAASMSCFHWNRAKPLLTNGSTFGGFLSTDQYRYRVIEVRTHFNRSSSIARSKFSTASGNLCWSRSNSPLYDVKNCPLRRMNEELSSQVVWRFAAIRERVDSSYERRLAFWNVSQLVHCDRQLNV